MNHPLLIISGPTATGKTALAIDLASMIQQTLGQTCEVVNFDSLLFYRELTIGTAKPNAQEQARIAHHLIDNTSIKTPINVAHFRELALPIINELHRDKIIPLLVGGSAFYLRALIKGMYDGPKIPEALSASIQQNYQQKGIEPIRAYLADHDPESFKTLHPNDHYRILRAYEYHRYTGEQFSAQKNELVEPYNLARNDFPLWGLHHIYLNIPPQEHWPLIEKRTRVMLDEGLIQEVADLLKKGFTGQERPLQSIGYKETIDYLTGEDTSLEQLVERISIATRQLAKSQRTFFNKLYPKTTYHPLKERVKIEKDVLDWLSQGNF